MGNLMLRHFIFVQFECVFPIISERSRENQNDLILRRAKDIFKGEALLKRRLLANSLRNNSHNFLFYRKSGIAYLALLW